MKVRNTMADANYSTVGNYLEHENATHNIPSSDLRPLVKCNRCGSIVNGGGLSRERHDEFHKALASLWDMLDK